MFRKLLIGALTVAGLSISSGEMKPVEASHRVRVYVGPRVTSVRWRGGHYRSVSPYRLGYGYSASVPYVPSAGYVGVGQPMIYGYPSNVLPAGGYIGSQPGVYCYP